MENNRTPSKIASTFDLQIRHAVASCVRIPHSNLTVIPESAAIESEEFTVGVASGERWFGVRGVLRDGQLEITNAGSLPDDPVTESLW